MSSMRISKKSKACTVALLVSLAFIICAVFSSFCFSDGSAAEGDTVDRNEAGVRFVQVATGEDFAIGLTYNGDLYGWSLLDNDAATVGSPSATSLSRYYSTVPTKINVTFINGPSSDTDTWSGADYHTERREADKIIQIAATRYTAAFITQSGAIYTWGIDNTDAAYEGGKSARLLLRDGTGGRDPSVLEPYMINYDYYIFSNVNPMANIKPTSTGGAITDMSIAGGEYNYIFVYRRGGNYRSFVWGSLLYGVTNRDGAQSFSVSGENDGILIEDNYRRVYETSISGGTAKAVAGGYTVGINTRAASESGSTSLLLHGKNFVVPNGNVEWTGSDTSAQEYAVIKTTELYNNEDVYLQYNATLNDSTLTRINGAIAGGRYSSESNNILSNDPDHPTYYARQAASAGTSLTFAPDTNFDGKRLFVYDSQGNRLRITDSEGATVPDNYSQIILNNVSLGNDIGYGITSNGYIYAWGDNSQGQGGSGSTSVSNPRPTRFNPSGIENDTYISVAAGKQVTGIRNSDNTDSRSRAFITDTFTGGANISFSAGVKNDVNYISGALNSSGNLYVWSNSQMAPKQIKFGNIDKGGEYSKFAAVYSGYGNNIVAVTAQGKVVLIQHGGAKNGFISCGDGNYRQKIYDTFRTRDGASAATQMENWRVNNDNSARFTVATDDITDKNEPSLGALTFFLDKAVANQDTVFVNDTRAEAPSTVTPGTITHDKYLSNRRSLVDLNNIGDKYRLLDPDKDDDKTFLTATASTLNRDALKPKFYLNGVEMTSAQRENMFDYLFVYSTTDGVGLRIAPKQSSKGGTVTAELYIARYDCAENYKITTSGASENVTPTDNAVYYDYKLVTLSFTVDNTPAYNQLAAFRDLDGEATGSGNGNSYIPLLDPNNEYNKCYSVAVQNVSAGVEKLVEYLTGSQNQSFIDAITERIKLADQGFPDENKIVNGNLEYYLGSDEAHRAYSGAYMWFINDRDGDLVRLAETGAVSILPSGTVNRNAVEVAPVVVTINVNIPSGLNLTESKVSRISTDFNNMYGLYDIKFNKTGSDYTSMSFKYDIVRMTAVAATGNLEYANARVDSYKTTADGNSISFNIRTNEFNKYSYGVSSDDIESGVYYPLKALTGAGNVSIENFGNVAYVFSKPSVRFKDGSKYGAHDAANNGNTVDIEIPNVAVGSSYTINLSDYINCADGIFFTYNNSNRQQEYNAFMNKFPSETDKSKNTVTLSSNKIVFSPVTTANEYFTLDIQRFKSIAYAEDNSHLFGSVAATDEKITLNISFINIVGVTFESTLTDNKMHTNISLEGYIDLLGGEGAINTERMISAALGEGYNSRIVISNIVSTDTSVLRATNGNSNTRVRVTPVSSGRAVVMFSATLFGSSIPFTVEFTVSGLTTIPGEIKLDSVKYVYVNDLLIKLNDANPNLSVKENYNILYNDISAAGRINAVSFVNAATGETLDGYPEFIESVTFAGLSNGQSGSDTRIRLVLKTDALQTTGSYYMRVKFVDTVHNGYQTYEEYRSHNLPVLETSQAISSSLKLLLQTNEDGSTSVFTLNVNCDEPKPSELATIDTDWHTEAIDGTKAGINDNMKIVLPIRYLAGLVSGETIFADQYIGKLAQVSSAASEYINAYISGTNVVIEPLYNTPVNLETGASEPVTVNVTIKNKGNENDIMILSFRVGITGISTTLPKDDYNLIWLVAACVSFALLFIIFLSMMIVYWNKRAKQRALIKRNKELIKMRDRIHGKTASATRDELVKSKLKMENPKFAAKYNELKNAQGDVDELDGKGKKKKKKKGGKKTIADLKAELEAKKAAFAQATSDGMDPFANAVDVDAQSFGSAPAYDAQNFDQGFGGDQGFADNQNFGGDQGFADNQGFGGDFGGEQTFEAQDIDGNSIIFDAGDIGDGAQG